jgi:hypothetical protein
MIRAVVLAVLEQPGSDCVHARYRDQRWLGDRTMSGPHNVGVSGAEPLSGALGVGPFLIARNLRKWLFKLT